MLIQVSENYEYNNNTDTLFVRASHGSIIEYIIYIDMSGMKLLIFSNVYSHFIFINQSFTFFKKI